MTNAWIDDDLYREGWVKSVGPTALHVYLAATNVLHREARDDCFVRRWEVVEEYPWPLSDEEFEAAIQRLVARDRIVVDGDLLELPQYEFEQENSAKRKDRKAINKINAAKGMKDRKRDEKGRLRPANFQQVAGSPTDSLDVALDRPASDPYGPKGPSVPKGPKTPAPRPKRPRAKLPEPAFSPEDFAIEPPSLPATVSEPAPTAVARVEEPPRDAVAETLNWLATTEPDTPVDQVWRHHRIRFAIATGGNPTQKREHFIQLTRLTKEHGAREVIRRLDNFYDSPLWKDREGAKDLGRFIASFDLYAGTATDGIVRKYEFQEAAAKWIATANGQASRLPPEVLRLITPSEVPY